MGPWRKSQMRKTRSVHLQRPAVSKQSMRHLILTEIACVHMGCTARSMVDRWALAHSLALGESGLIFDTTFTRTLALRADVSIHTIKVDVYVGMKDTWYDKYLTLSEDLHLLTFAVPSLIGVNSCRRKPLRLYFRTCLGVTIPLGSV